MGCTPSIHVSQGGVVYCQDSDDSPSSYSGANHQIGGNGTHGKFKSGSNTVDTSPEVGGTQESSAMPSGIQGNMRAIRSGLMLPCLSHGRETSEAETQTTKLISPLVSDYLLDLL